jgi:hypothetical protein
MIAALLLATLTPFVNHGATPERAALNVVYPSRSGVTVERVNVAGPYATVLLKGGMMEGSPADSAILLERFSFGWQPLEILNFVCRLKVHGLGSRTYALLMHGMPVPKDDRPCSGEWADAGPRSAVEAVRLQMRGPLVPSVFVAGDFALGQWYGAGGGQDLFRFANGTWKLVDGGGGAMGTSNMIEHGVPKSDWCALHVYGVKCP